jgi:hypothetical protein
MVNFRMATIGLAALAISLTPKEKRMLENNYDSLSAWEAAILLRACQPLLKKLRYEGYKAALNEEELAQLMIFKKLSLDGWFNDTDIFQMAGMARCDIALLHTTLRYRLAVRMREMHHCGEQC